MMHIFYVYYIIYMYTQNLCSNFMNGKKIKNKSLSSKKSKQTKSNIEPVC